MVQIVNNHSTNTEFKQNDLFEPYIGQLGSVWKKDESQNFSKWFYHNLAETNILHCQNGIIFFICEIWHINHSKMMIKTFKGISEWPELVVATVCIMIILIISRWQMRSLSFNSTILRLKKYIVNFEHSKFPPLWQIKIYITNFLFIISYTCTYILQISL